MPLLSRWLTILSAAFLVLGSPIPLPLYPLTPALDAAARKPSLGVSFHVQVRDLAPDPFCIPIQLTNPRRQIFIERTPSITERHVSAVHVFPAEDGSWGCLFQLDPSGRIALANLSNSARGKSLVFYLGNEKLGRQVLDIHIDVPVFDGLLPVSRGLTAQEAASLKKTFPSFEKAKAKAKESE